MNQPAGIRPRSKKIKEGNEMAKQAIMFARWAHNEFDATVTFENPDRSYLWIFGMPWFGPPRTYKDVRMSDCHFGREYKKDTHLRVWGTSFDRIAKLCTKCKGHFSCGRAENKHLGFDGMPTKEATAYPEALCKQYASIIREAAGAQGPPLVSSLSACPAPLAPDQAATTSKEGPKTTPPKKR